MGAFRRWLTKPAISIADGIAIASLTLAADAIKLGWHLPWGIVLLIVWGATTAALFGTGFIKGFARSALADIRRWRAGKDS